MLLFTKKLSLTADLLHPTKNPQFSPMSPRRGMPLLVVTLGMCILDPAMRRHFQLTHVYSAEPPVTATIGCLAHSGSRQGRQGFRQFVASLENACCTWSWGDGAWLDRCWKPIFIWIPKNFPLKFLANIQVINGVSNHRNNCHLYDVRAVKLKAIFASCRAMHSMVSMSLLMHTTSLHLRVLCC